MSRLNILIESPYGRRENRIVKILWALGKVNGGKKIRTNVKKFGKVYEGKEISTYMQRRGQVNEEREISTYF